MRAVRFVVAIGLLYAAASCGGKASVNQSSTPPCATRVPAVHPADTVTVVVSDRIDFNHAPWPQNRAEQFVFGHLYETLVNVDCHDVVQPGIAKSWKRASDGWYIEIQEDAHFWDDKPVTAYDVKTSFGPWDMFRVDPVDETHLIIHGGMNIPDIRVFALPAFAIAKKADYSSEMIGTGPWEIGDSGMYDQSIHPTAAAMPVVRFSQTRQIYASDIVAGTDESTGRPLPPRLRADAMITDLADVIEYAESRHYGTAPLEWDQAYVLVSRSRALILNRGQNVDDLPASLQDDLARNAVTVDARGGSTLLRAVGELSNKQSDVITQSSSAPSVDQLAPRIVYYILDDVAGQLAKRIVALAAMDTSTSQEARALSMAMPGKKTGLRAVGLNYPSDLDQALSQGADFGYVVPLSWNSDFPIVTRFNQTGPWLLNNTALLKTLIPLVETRAHFIAMTDRISYIDEKNGTVRIMPPGVERAR